jgi:hypothetical protein
MPSLGNAVAGYGSHRNVVAINTGVCSQRWDRHGPGLVQSSLNVNVTGSMAVALPTGCGPVDNAATAKDAHGIERGEGGMSGELSLKAAVAWIASVECGRRAAIGSPVESSQACAVDLSGPAWV